MDEFRFLKPLLLTVGFELAGAYALGIRKPQRLILIALANALTNPLLQAAAGLTARYVCTGLLYVIIFCIYEPLIVLSEGWIYRCVLPEESHPFRLSFILNVISLAGGFIWNIFVH